MHSCSYLLVHSADLRHRRYTYIEHADLERPSRCGTQDKVNLVVLELLQIYRGLISNCAGIGYVNAFWVGPHFQLCEELEMSAIGNERNWK